MSKMSNPQSTITESLSFTIKQTWDGKPSQTEINIQLSPETRGTLKGLLIGVDAPFFNDPQLPAAATPGRMDNLWDFEVVEIFFLGEDDKYLEVELGPHGQYLLLQLHGQRNLVKDTLQLEHYATEVKGSRWYGEAFIPIELFPSMVSKMNAYAIHKSGVERTYMALFPVTDKSFELPDFHRLHFFQPIQLPSDWTESCKSW